MVSHSSLWSFVLLASASLVAGHGAIIKAVGDAGGQGSAIGVDPTTPRDGTNRNPFQQDSTRFRGDAADTFGETLGGGTNDPETGVSQVLAQNGGTLPQVKAGGTLMMTLHQVNGDGAGPYSCAIDTTGTGTNWQTVQVTSQVPGEDSRNRDGAETDFPLNVQVPAGTACTGTAAGQTGVCMVRCENTANAGPFGGVVPMQMAVDGAATAAPAAAGTNTTATAATTSTTTSDTLEEARKLKLRTSKLARGLTVKERRAALNDFELWSKRH